MSFIQEKCSLVSRSQNKRGVPNTVPAVYTDKGQEYLQQAEANEATINKTQRRKLRKLSYTAKPVTVRIHRKDILLAFLALGNRETLPPDVKKYLTQTIEQKPI